MSWVETKERNPDKDGLYKIRANDWVSHVKQAYYVAETDYWVHDDGFWLPCDIGPYVTH